MVAATRKKFRAALRSGKLQRMPGAFSPLVAKLIQDLKFDGVYISGAGLAADLGVPDIGLTTLAEVAGRSGAIARSVDLPTLADIDTGFGEIVNVARAIEMMEAAGVSGIHIEDQIMPKRCGHLDGKELVDIKNMQQRIKAALAAKSDPDFLIMGRTDARSVEGLDKAIARAKAYVDAGAEAIFAEALESEKEFEKFRSAIKVPLLANMTEFGKSPFLTAKQLENLGYNIVIYPMTGWRLALKAIEDGFREIKKAGTQSGLIDDMQTRKRLYELLDYDSYAKFDKNIFNFKLRK
ncbi:MAG: methylisocitrate lyase [Dongiaceae bacterium]